MVLTLSMLAADTSSRQTDSGKRLWGEGEEVHFAKAAHELGRGEGTQGQLILAWNRMVTSSMGGGVTVQEIHLRNSRTRVETVMTIAGKCLGAAGTGIGEAGLSRGCSTRTGQERSNECAERSWGWGVGMPDVNSGLF